MLYTIGCGFFAGMMTYIICKVLNVDFDPRCGIGAGYIITFLGTIIGLSVGAGYGTAKIFSGNYP